MAEQLTSNTEALRLFFTEDIYLIASEVTAPVPVLKEEAVVPQETVVLEATVAQKAVAPEDTVVPQGTLVSGETVIQKAVAPEETVVPQGTLVPRETVAQKAVVPEDIDVINKTELSSVTAADYKFIGENARKVLILVNDPDNAVSTAPGTALLWKIVAAIKLSPNDCAVLNYQHYQGHSYEELNAFFRPQLLLSFGIAPAVLGLQEQQTEILGQQNGVKAIFSSELNALEVNITIKKALWKSLQQLTLS
jgi:DNA polymerase III psi subunit